MKLKSRKFLLLILICISMLLSTLGCSLDISTDEINVTNDTTSVTYSSSDLSISPLKITFIDVGQGDCTLFECDNQYMLIDAGDNNKGSTIKTYLQKQNIDTLDIVIGTHPDSDHIGGLDVVLYNFDCKNVILSKKEKDTRTYDDVITTCKQKNYKIQYPEIGTEYTLGDTKVVIISDNTKTYSSANDSSVCVLVIHGDNRFLFTGDCEELAEKDLLKSNLVKSNVDFSNIDLYKVAHHGSKTSSSDKFFELVNPKYAVISCGEGNSYGHPHATTINKLLFGNIETYRTDEQGTIIATSDGKQITFNMSPSTSWQVGE